VEAISMSEKRKHPRQRMLKPGRIVFNHKYSVISCTVRNLSVGGACLEVASTIGIPDCFDLAFETDVSTRPCHVAWKSERRIGVAFS
jgi:hypothetical protein